MTRILYPSINTDDTRILIASQIEFNICSFKYKFDVVVFSTLKNDRMS